MFRKFVLVFVVSAVGLLALFLVVLGPSIEMRKHLKMLQNEEYAKGCKHKPDEKIPATASEPVVAKGYERKGQNVARDGDGEFKPEEGINCPDTASRANLIAIDGLRMSSFAGMVAYLLGFGSLLSIWIALRSGTGGSNEPQRPDEVLVALGLSTTGPDHATLTVMNVGRAPIWLRSVHLNDDPAVFGGTAGGMICLHGGGSHAFSTCVRHRLGGAVSTVQVGYSEIIGECRFMSAVLVHIGGKWYVQDVRYHE